MKCGYKMSEAHLDKCLAMCKKRVKKAKKKKDKIVLDLNCPVKAKGSEGKFCHYMYNPVICIGDTLTKTTNGGGRKVCHYANICSAKLAGFDFVGACHRYR